MAALIERVHADDGRAEHNLDVATACLTPFEYRLASPSRSSSALRARRWTHGGDSALPVRWPSALDFHVGFPRESRIRAR